MDHGSRALAAPLFRPGGPRQLEIRERDNLVAPINARDTLSNLLIELI